MNWRSLVRAVKQRLFPALKKVPGPVYTDLVLTWKQPHERIERLRCVCQKGEVNGRKVTLIRIVDPVELGKRGLTVRGYADLDGHVEVMCYEGWFGFVPESKVELTALNPPKVS
jgi:hypothetical protein